MANLCCRRDETKITVGRADAGRILIHARILNPTLTRQESCVTAPAAVDRSGPPHAATKLTRNGNMPAARSMLYGG
jgi:hypothetical protein